MKKSTSYKKGLWAENYAAWFLRFKGYRIIQNRYKSPFGEIDVVALKSGGLVCVEVKYRPNVNSAMEAVSPRSQKRIIAAAEFFRAHHPKYAAANVRFDVITVAPLFGIRHHQNAWYDS